MRDDIKLKIAQMLSTSEKKDTCLNSLTGTDVGQGYGKPVFPSVPAAADEDLSQFIGQDSWIFFTILNLDTDFLSLPVAQWEGDSSYREGKVVVSELCVVNDAAEREVKLCCDFLQSAKKEKNLQNVLQVVEN